MINRLVVADDINASYLNKKSIVGKNDCNNFEGLGYDKNTEQLNLNELKNKSTMMEDHIDILKSKLENINKENDKSKKYLQNYQKKLNCKVFTIRRIKNDMKNLETTKNEIEHFIKSILASDDEFIQNMHCDTIGLLGKRMDKASKKLMLAYEKKNLKKKFMKFVQENSKNIELLESDEKNDELINNAYQILYKNVFDKDYKRDVDDINQDKSLLDIIPNGFLQNYLTSNQDGCDGGYFDDEEEAGAEIIYQTKKIKVSDKNVQIVGNEDKATSVQGLFMDEPKQLDSHKMDLETILNDCQINTLGNLTQEAVPMSMEVREYSVPRKSNKKSRRSAGRKNSTNTKSMNANALLNFDTSSFHNDNSSMKINTLLSSKKKAGSPPFKKKINNNKQSIVEETMRKSLDLEVNLVTIQIYPKTPIKVSNKDKNLNENNLFDDHVFNLNKKSDSKNHNNEELFAQDNLLSNLNLASVFDQETIVDLPDFASPTNNMDSIYPRGNNNSFSFKKDFEMENFVPNEVSDFRVKVENIDKENARPYNSEYQNKRGMCTESLYLNNLFCGNLTIDKRNQR